MRIFDISATECNTSSPTESPITKRLHCSYIDSLVQLCLHGVLTAEVIGKGVVVLLPLGDKLLLVAGTLQVPSKLIPGGGGKLKYYVYGQH